MTFILTYDNFFIYLVKHLCESLPMRREETGSDPSVHWIRESCSLLNKDPLISPANPRLTRSKRASVVIRDWIRYQKTKKRPIKKIKLRL
jgi:hypothetical protein